MLQYQQDPEIYAFLDGTSMAAPFAAAGGALLLSQRPHLTPELVIELLNDNVTPLGSLDGLVASGGTLNLPGALGAPVRLRDDFAKALLIGGLEGVVEGSNAGASRERGEPRHAGNIGGSSVWFEWTAPVSGTVEFNTGGSGFDTLLAVYTGTRVDRLRRVAQNSNHGTLPTSLLTFRARAGVRYQIAVDGFNAGQGADSGLVRLNWFYRAIPVTGVSLDQTRLTLDAGSSAQLTATVLPAEAFNKGVTWSSSRPSVASVDATGLVTAHSPGRATITVRTVDGNRRATCRVTVITAD